MNVYEHKWIFMNINECKWTFMKNLNVPKNDKERNIFQNVLKRSQKINVNDQNSMFIILDLLVILLFL